jgi:hypothetical protein
MVCYSFFFLLIILNFVEEEFTQYYLNERLAFSKHISQPIVSLKDPLKVSPEAFDWRNYSAVTDVKNQVNKNLIKIILLKIFLLLLL